MRTSRIARETAKIITRGSNNSSSGRPQTRSFAATLQTFTAVENSHQDTAAPRPESSSEDESSLSSISSTAILDIEDIASPVFPTRKRKRELIGSSPNLTSGTTKPNIRASPRKSSHHTENEPARNPKKARRQPAKGILNEAGEVEIHAPANWGEIYETVREMRKSTLAPVDTMGCETLAEERISPRVRLWSALTLHTHLTYPRTNAFRH